MPHIRDYNVIDRLDEARKAASIPYALIAYRANMKYNTVYQLFRRKNKASAMTQIQYPTIFRLASAVHANFLDVLDIPSDRNDLIQAYRDDIKTRAYVQVPDKKKLRAARKRARLSLQKAAGQTSLSVNTLNRYEYGLTTPDDKILARLAAAYNATIDDVTERIPDCDAPKHANEVTYPLDLELAAMHGIRRSTLASVIQAPKAAVSELFRCHPFDGTQIRDVSPWTIYAVCELMNLDFYRALGITDEDVQIATSRKDAEEVPSWDLIS